MIIETVFLTSWERVYDDTSSVREGWGIMGWVWLSYRGVVTIGGGGVSKLCFLSESIQHEDRSMSNAKALLQSAWIGDAVSLKRYLVRTYIHSMIIQFSPPPSSLLSLLPSLPHPSVWLSLS